MKNRILTLVMILFAVVPVAMAQDCIVRVSNQNHPTGSGKQHKGAKTNDGQSWTSPMLDIQDAIDYVVSQGGGEVWVAQGTYTPTKSIDTKSSDERYYSFNIPAGVTVRGGFEGWEDSPEDRETAESDAFGISYAHRTILSGDLGPTSSLTWNSKKQQYDVSFSGNCFHVVWFGDVTKFSDGRAGVLSGEAVLEGCFIQGGNAGYDSQSVKDHTSYGGGIYMVDGAVVENCYISGCSAARDGGGIYMDGGGEVKHTAVVKCQALGLGISYGYGGGICIDGNGSRTAKVSRCGVSACVGRMGGGVAVLASSAANKDALKVTSTVIVNNTATTEAGGIYTQKGGVLSHLTVARNKCNGSGVYINGMTTGRSAGLYCRDNATVVNSVFWGGGCSANNDVQYANSVSDKTIQVQLKYVGLSNTSYVDWSTTQKVGVTKLSIYNNQSEATAANANVSKGEGFPLFYIIKSDVGACETSAVDAYGNPLTDSEGNELVDGDGNPLSINIGQFNLYYGNWHPKPTSTINNRGIDNVLGGTESTIDLVETSFSARCTLGSYHIKAPDIDVETTNLYVDPEAQAVDTEDPTGASWDNPIRFLGDALDFVSSQEGGTYNIYVKAGTVDNTRSDMTSANNVNRQGDEGEIATDIRDCSLEVPSNVSLYGGYSSLLTGTDLSSRNPVLTPTIITANIDDTYSGNAKTLLYFSGSKDVVFDGFQVRYANNTAAGGLGGAMRFANGSNVTVKNCVIAGCYAGNGAAVYATGVAKRTMTKVDFENCIFHNNQTSQINDSHYGIIYANDNTTLTFDHCDLLHNVGYAIVNNSINDINIENSVFYANLKSKDISDTNGHEDDACVALARNTAAGYGSFTSTNKANLFDSKAGSIADGLTNIPTRLSYTYNNKIGTEYPLFMNSTRSAGVSSYGYYSDDTYYGRATSFQPLSLNPMVNAAYYEDGESFGTDMTTVVTRNYGGLPDIGAIENHYSEDEGENSNKEGQLGYGKVVYVRDYRNSDGSIDYTRGGDGYSWTNAINGNAYYDEFSGTYKGRYSYGEQATGKTTTKEVYTPGSTLSGTPANGSHFVLSFTYNGTTYYYTLSSVIEGGDYQNNNSYFTVGLTTDPDKADVFRYENGNSNGGAIYAETQKYYVGWDGHEIVPILKYNYRNPGERWMNTYQLEHFKNKWLFDDEGVIYTIDGNIAYQWYANIDLNNIEDYVSGSSLVILQGGQNDAYTAFNIQIATKTTKTVDITTRVNYMSGLQYAVNRASRGFDAGAWQAVSPSEIEIGDLVSDSSNGSNPVHVTVKNLDTWREKTTTVYGKDYSEVWVGAGKYEKDNESNATATGLFSLDSKLNSCVPNSEYTMGIDAANKRVSCDESCFIMRDGVNVYGAFPSEGNPGKEHRHPLVSQYVHVEGDYDPTYYETILQPVTTSLESGKVRRVLGQALEYNVGNQKGATSKELHDNGFKGATWDGFTIRYGNVDAATIVESRMNGAAGVSVYQNATVKNCVITENTQFLNNANSSSSHGWRGGGVFVQGGTVINCYIINNRMYSLKTGQTVALNDIKNLDPTNGYVFSTGGYSAYGAGIYFYHGTVYNCVIANNVISGEQAYGAGVFMDQIVNFFNNTVVNNKAINQWHSAGGVAVYTNTGVSIVNMYNSIIANNEGYGAYGSSSVGDRNVMITNGGKVYVTNCLVDNVSYDCVNSDLQHTSCNYISSSDYSNLFRSSIGSFTTDPSVFKTLNLRLQKTTVGEKAINKGQNVPVINDVKYDLSTYTDMDYNDRIQDCTIDIGAYEYNDANSIVPTESYDATNKITVAYYYVTPDGKGNATATDPANAACADKFQSVLDAAGRYKYQHPSNQVIVRVANSYNLLHPTSSADKPTNFQYYARRTTDTDNDDARVWSIMVPRGVEVWGGYTDVPMTLDADNNVVKDTDASHTWSNTYNGFYSGSTDLRDVLDNATYFDSYYYNKSKEQYAYTYHVLTFTDKLFDADGNPYLSTEEASMKAGTASASTGALGETYLSLADALKDNTANYRSVIDGIFITGGKADIKRTTDYNAKVNINSYGGAAIVTDYAHIRNCIVRNNEGTYGGALALEGNALVSGCLIDQNEADEYGGGIYVFENGTKLSNGDVVNTVAATGENLDAQMPHVYTSTIVNNHASVQGGGIWYSSENANVRVNSSLLWQNMAPDLADVAGLYNPVLQENDDAVNFYPFSYCAFLNMNVSGVNNQSLNGENADGVRFTKSETNDALAVVKESASQKQGVYDPTLYDDFGYYKPTYYSALLRRGMPLANYQELEQNAGLSTSDFAGAVRRAGNRKYVDVGARVRVKELPNGDLMLRIYVAQSSDVDATAAQAMVESKDSYYSQEGSSFANPMTSLQDALDYIVYQRQNASGTGEGNAKRKNSNKLPFEIILSRGNYIPSTSLTSNSDYTVANTFAIPEGVSIYGGFYSQRNKDSKTYYGKYYTPKSDRSSYSNTLSDNVERVATSPVIGGYTLSEMTSDEMLENRQHSDLNNNDIYEPWEYQYQTFLLGNAESAQSTGAYHIVTVVPDKNVVGTLPPVSKTNSGDFTGKTAKEVGQPVVFDGITFKNGYGHNYQNKAMDESGVRTFFQGGAILVDGNRIVGSKGTVEYQAPSTITDGVGYRDIPVYIAKCFFNGNKSGMGGALATNTSTSIFSSYFAQNMAKANNSTETVTFTDDEGKQTVNNSLNYPGVGGAVYYTGALYVANSIFANNEAQNDGSDPLTATSYKAFSNPAKQYIAGIGGALFGGSYSHLYMTNTDIVRNKANLYPAVFTLNPNIKSSVNEIVNSVVWGNELNSDITLTDTYKFAGSLICNYAKTAASTYTYDFSSGVPASQADLDANYTESAWFTAYEAGRGKKAVNSVDKRDVTLSLVTDLVSTTLLGGQNCNVNISSTNNILEGPNFKSPANDAGYDNYNESADWSPMRISSLTDQGSGRIAQTHSGTTYSFGTDMSGLYAAVRGANAYSQKYMPIGSDTYMENASTSTVSPIYRISLDYKVNSPYTYVDLGAYEYIRAKLEYDTDDDNVDIMWVAPITKGTGNGKTWENATSDVQTAITTLLSARNGHRKEVRFENYGRDDTRLGSFSAISANTDGTYAFLIDTKSLNEASEEETQKILSTDVTQRYVKSLTFRGGYSIENKYSDNAGTIYTYDPYKYPAIVRGQNRSDVSSDKWDHLFYIKDASQRYGLDYSTYHEQTATGKTFWSDNGYGWWPSSADRTIHTIPIEFDGLTLINNQTTAGAKGAAIYYADQKFDVNSNISATATTYTASCPTDIDLTEKYADGTKVQGVKTSPAKLILSKCKILGSGSHYDSSCTDNTSSAVYVGQYGGDALMYNNVFHSNYGSPLVAYNAKTVNNTFAMNAGKVDLKGTSSILNSVMWKNNSIVSGYGDQFALASVTATTFNHNAYTGCSVTSTDYESDAVKNNNYNVALDNDNTDVIYGPNFVDPENTDIESRSFTINPSVRLFNKGNNANYNNSIVLDAVGNVSSAVTIYDYTIPYLYTDNNGNVSVISSTNYDVDAKTRFMNGTIDLGASEFQSALARVIYVDPTAKSGYDGTSWYVDKDTNKGPIAKLQSAIDLGALYNASTSDSDSKAFVFVKGATATNKSLHTGENIILRNGVQVYASLPSGSNALSDCASESDADIKAYIPSVLSLREGIASPSANKTYVLSISTPKVEFTTPTVIDGLVVAPVPGESASVSSPVVNIATTDAAASHLALRNIIVTGFTATSGNLVNLDKALLYEALIHDNTISSGSALNVGENGWAVNVTVDGKTTGTTANVLNSIINFTSDQKNSFSGACYTLSDANLNYQLTEGSKSIDAQQSDPASIASNLKVDAFGRANINYASDRDLLGNPRLLTVTSGKKVDNGAFETWRIDNDFTTTTSGHKYPHNGSVVYIMDGKSLVCGTTFIPGYLLVKDGASLYGEGNTVNVAYVGVERADIQSTGSVVSLPYAMTYASNVAVATTDATSGVTTFDKDAANIYTYNGSARADWQYSLAKTNSSCWTSFSSSTEIAANQGVLYVPNANHAGKTLRFTASSGDMDKYVYTESATAESKTVKLSVYNDYESTNGAADFTSSENMGWNCIGLPYLVSDYKTHETLATDVFMMDAPHKMWLYYDGKTAPNSDAVAAGGFYEVSSWLSSAADWHVSSASDARIWAGEGFFVQNARLSDAEELVFYRPEYSSGSGAKLSNVRYFTDSVQDIAQETASDIVVYAQKHTLYVKNITDGADIAVYTTAGKAELRDHTENSEYSVSLENGIHIVNVNGKSFKIYVK